MIVWDEITRPKEGQYAFRLIKNMPYGNWSWFKDSENRVGISLEVQSASIDTNFKPSKYFLISTLNLGGMGNILTVVCQDKEFYEVFEVLCRDLVDASKEASVLDEAIALLEARLVLWTELLRGLKGATRQEVYGLAAELSFLNIWLDKQENKNLDIWVGPNGKSQDFISMSGLNAIEIKASSNDLVSVKISSMDQLDFAGDLVLAVFPVSAANDQSMNQINLEFLISSVEGKLPSNQIDNFKKKLAMTGIHLNKAANDFYFSVGEPKYYEVSSGFPRIIRANIATEIFNCSYDISLTSLSEFATSQINAISRLSK